MTKTDLFVHMLQDIAKVRPTLMLDKDQIECLVYPAGHNPSKLIREAIEIYQRNNEYKMTKQYAFDEDQIELFRQWFDAVQDLNSIYLEPKDYRLAKHLYELLGMRVNSSIERGIIEKPNSET